MDLQTIGGMPVTSENASPIDNLRAHSPQIPDDNRPQPDTSAIDDPQAPRARQHVRRCSSNVRILPNANDSDNGERPRTVAKSAALLHVSLHGQRAYRPADVICGRRRRSAVGSVPTGLRYGGAGWHTGIGPPRFHLETTQPVRRTVGDGGNGQSGVGSLPGTGLDGLLAE